MPELSALAVTVNTAGPPPSSTVASPMVRTGSGGGGRGGGGRGGGGRGGVKPSLSSMVPRARPTRIVAPCALLRFTANVSAASGSESSITGTSKVAESSPAPMVSVPVVVV